MSSKHETTFAASGLPTLFAVHARPVDYLLPDDDVLSIEGVVGPVEISERTSDRGKLEIRSRKVVIRTDDHATEDRVTAPEINVDAVRVDGLVMTVTRSQPHGEDFATLTLEHEAISESERESFQDF